MSRPAVAVVLPFHGSRREAEEALALLAGLRLGEGDEAVLADNTVEHVAAGLPTAPGVRVLACEARQSAYGARNEGIAATTQGWIALLDADCRPVPDLLDRFFDPIPGDDVGALAGAVGGLPGQDGLVPAYARSRNHLDQERLLTEHVFRPMAVTANLLVRRAAWEDVGGFAEHVRSGADGDFCWRLQDAGWELGLRAGALAPHEHRPDVGALVRKALRDGAANPWLARRWPGYPQRVGVARQLLRAAVAIPGWIVRGQPQRAAFKAIDLAWTVATDAGTLLSNAAPRTPPPGDGRPTLLLREAPRRDDGTLSGLARDVRVEARARPVAGQDWRLGRRVELRVAEDDGPLARGRALAALARRRPAAVVHALAADGREALRLACAARRAQQAGGPVLDGDDPAAAALVRRLSGA